MVYSQQPERAFALSFTYRYCTNSSGLGTYDAAQRSASIPDVIVQDELWHLQRATITQMYNAQILFSKSSGTRYSGLQNCYSTKCNHIISLTF